MAGGSGGTTSTTAGTGGTAVSTGGSGGSSGSSAGTGGSGGGSAPSETRTYVYLGSGSWDGQGGGKLMVYAFDEETAALSFVQDVPAGDLNSFGAIDSLNKRLYATDEVAAKARAYTINAADGTLGFVNEVDTSDGAVFSTLDATGKYLLVAYYGAGGVEVYAVNADGSLGASVDSESTGSMAHSISLSPDNKFAFVPNKGSNYVSQFTFDASSGALTANTPATVPGGGDGPRHMAFHPGGLHAYLLNETDSGLTTFSVSNTAGTMTSMGSVPNAESVAGSASSDIHVTADGKFVYASNREDEHTIAMYSIGADGALTLLGREPSHGMTPRNFAIHPTSNVLLVGNQESNNVATFRIQADGRLQFIETTDVGAPVFWVGLALLPE